MDANLLDDSEINPRKPPLPYPEERNVLKTLGTIQHQKSSIYERLNQDAKQRENRLKLLRERKYLKEMNELAAMNKGNTKKLKVAELDRAVNRLNYDAKQRQSTLETKRKVRKELEHHSASATKLAKEIQIIEAVYGIPGHLPLHRVSWINN